MDELLKFLAEKVSIQRRGNRIACYQERGTDWMEGWLAKRQFSFRKLSPHLLLSQEGFRVDELLPDAQDQKITLFGLYEADPHTLALYPGWIDQYVDCILFYEPVPLSREYDLYGWQVGMELTESDEGGIGPGNHGRTMAGLWPADSISVGETAQTPVFLGKGCASSSARCARTSPASQRVGSRSNSLSEVDYLHVEMQWNSFIRRLETVCAPGRRESRSRFCWRSSGRSIWCATDSISRPIRRRCRGWWE